MAFTVATAKRNITPTLATNPYMAGYGWPDGGRTISSDTPYEPLWCRAVLIRADGAPKLIISADILALPRSMHQRIRTRLIALANWATGDIMLQSTHTHNGPVLIDTLHPFISYGILEMDQILNYSRWLEDQFVQTAQDALNAAQVTVTLDYQVASQGWSVNRAGLPYVETDVPVLVARRSNGKPSAIIFGYGCHPVSAGDQTLFDGDYPAGACTYIENNSTAFALFLQGAAGDQNPANSGSWSARDQNGNSLGAAVLNTSTRAGRVLTGPIATKYQEVQLPLDLDMSAANLAQVRAGFAARLPNPNGQPTFFARHAQVMMARIDSGALAAAVPSPFQVWRIGGSTPLKMAFIGGEVVSGYAVYFRGRNGGSSALWFGGYANESCAYIPSDEFLYPFMSFGSYEGGWDPDFPGIAGGSMTVYGHMGHFKSSPNGVESAVINAMTALLA